MRALEVCAALGQVNTLVDFGVDRIMYGALAVNQNLSNAIFQSSCLSRVGVDTAITERGTSAVEYAAPLT